MVAVAVVVVFIVKKIIQLLCSCPALCRNFFFSNGRETRAARRRTARRASKQRPKATAERRGDGPRQRPNSEATGSWTEAEHGGGGGDGGCGCGGGVTVAVVTMAVVVTMATAEQRDGGPASRRRGNRGGQRTGRRWRWRGRARSAPMALAWTWGPPGPGGRAPPSPRRLRAVRNVKDEGRT